MDFKIFSGLKGRFATLFKHSAFTENDINSIQEVHLSITSCISRQIHAFHDRNRESGEKYDTVISANYVMRK